MSIKLGDNVQVQIPKPLDSKYLNDTIPYTGITQVNSCIASGLRNIGLTVNISNVEYWYCGGILDSCLVIKSAGGTVTGATNLGSGNGTIFTSVSGGKIQLKTLSGGTNVTLSCDGNYVAINATGGNASLSTFTISGDSTTTGFTVNHALNKQFVNVELSKAASPYSTVYTNVDRINANNVCITFDTAPPSGTNYNILIIG
jgi:hypothetical protein